MLRIIYTGKAAIRKYLQGQHISLFLPIIIGLICGLEAIIVRTIIPHTFGWMMDFLNSNKQFDVIILLGFLSGGAYLTGLLGHRAPETTGVGLDIAIEHYHLKSGKISAKFAPLKFASTLFTLGLGGSGGLVGPTAAMGQGTASLFSRCFRLSDEKSKIMALCGIAGCISGLLHTPFGAAIFTLELCYLSGILYGDLIPVLLSSISAYIMSARITQLLPFGYLLEQPHLFRTVVYETPFPWSLRYLLYCVITALFTTILVIIFIKTFLALQNFNREEISDRYGPVIGAVTVWVIAAIFFKNRLGDVLGQPGDLVEHCATGGYLLYGAIALLISRWLTTFLTVGFGGSGGLFSPTLLLGGLAGIIIARLFGASSTSVLVTTGMSAALTGVMNVPIAAIIMVIEAFGISFIIPAIIGSVISFLLANNLVIYPHVESYQNRGKE